MTLASESAERTLPTTVMLGGVMQTVVRGLVVGKYEWVYVTGLQESMEQRCEMQIVRRWICKMR